jgi:L-seryl-tRNA(Ser) seleniumtransferase
VDVGSGALQPIDDEPDVQGALEAGASLVFFSGDKLLGGPQAGIAVGRRALVERMASSALFRALRPDKVALAALEATLDEWLRAEAPPVEAMRRAALPSLEATVQSWRQRLPAKVKASVAQVEGAVGGGSLPGRTYPSVALAIEYPDPMRLARALMQGTPPVVARTHQGRLLLDARSVVPLGQSELLIAALEIALERCLGESSDSENGA